MKMAEQAFHDSFLTLAACLNKPVLQVDIDASRFDAVEKAFAKEAAHRKRSWTVFHLLLEGFHMIAVDMCVPQDMDQIARSEAAGVGYEVGQQGVAGNVEGHAQTQVA